MILIDALTLLGTLSHTFYHEESNIQVKNSFLMKQKFSQQANVQSKWTESCGQCDWYPFLAQLIKDPRKNQGGQPVESPLCSGVIVCMKRYEINLSKLQSLDAILCDFY